MKIQSAHGETLALIDSGASHSLIHQDIIERLYPEHQIHATDIKLKSVTGQSLEVKGCCELAFQVAPELRIDHRFLVVEGSTTHQVILGLDFLADPERKIRHDLSDFILTYHKTPIPLYNAHQQQPSANVSEVRAKGRHQYVSPGSITFIKVEVVGRNTVRETEVKQSQENKITDCLEFHGHPVIDGTPTPLDCLFEAEQMTKDNLCVAVINTTTKGWTMKNGETLGYVTPVSSQPFYDVISAVEREQENPDIKPESGSGRSQIPTQADDRDRVGNEEFLKAFRYGENLTESQLKEIQAMLVQYRDCFAMEGDALGRCNRIEHRIDTTTDEPVVSAPYRIPKSQETAVKELVGKMLQQKLIRKSSSEYSSPVVLVQKPDGSIRFCVNYQKLNAISKKRTFPLPKTDELLAKIGENQPKWFSSSDLAAAFHQVPIREEDKHKTAFVLPFGLFSYEVLPMGLSGSPWTFARLGQEIFGEMLSKEGMVLFIDDMCLYGPTFDHHMKTWREVLDLLRKNNLKLKPSKTHLFTNKGLAFLGHHVGPEGISPNPTKIQAIAEYPVPQTVKDVRAFVALCSYFRKHVPKFATLAAPLNAMTRKGVHFKWTEECEAAFAQLKSALTNSNLLAYPRFEDKSKPFIITTDASDSGIGGWLSQEDEHGEKRPIAFYSRTFNTAESRYSVIEKEALAIVACIQAFHYYIHGRHFELHSDHAPLRYVLSHAQKGRIQNTRLERWKLSLQGLDMIVKYIPGPKNVVADALSRGALPIKWSDFQERFGTEDPDIGLGIVALFQQDQGNDETTESSQAQVLVKTPSYPCEEEHTANPKVAAVSTQDTKSPRVKETLRISKISTTCSVKTRRGNRLYSYWRENRLKENRNCGNKYRILR